MLNGIIVEGLRKEFLDHIHSLVEYWSEVDERDAKEKLEGLAFSILSSLDGCSDLPPFILAPLSAIKEGECNIKDYNITGCLHELFYQR